MADLAQDDEHEHEHERLTLARVLQDNRKQAALLNELRLSNEYLKLEVWAANDACAAMTEQLLEMRAAVDEARQGMERLGAVEASLCQLQEKNTVSLGHEEPAEKEEEGQAPKQEDLRPASSNGSSSSMAVNLTTKSLASRITGPEPRKQAPKQVGLRPASGNKKGKANSTRLTPKQKRLAWWNSQQGNNQPDDDDENGVSFDNLGQFA